MRNWGCAFLALALTWSASARASDEGDDSATTAASAATAGGTATSSSPSFDHRMLREQLEAQVDVIESSVAATKLKVDLLKEAVLGGAISKCKALIIHKNDMGSGFVLEKAVYTLDGEVIFSKEDTKGGLDSSKLFELYNGAISPGSHRITVSLVYRGSSLIFFTYLEGYKFQVESKYDLVAQDGKLNKLEIVSYTKGDITRETAEKLAVRYDLQVLDAPSISEEASRAKSTPAAETPPPGAE